MKKILFLSAVLLFGLTSCNNITSDGVMIDGVRWAMSNVDTPGTFARNPESTGSFFAWEEAQKACPRGWRLPTSEELRSLANAIGSEWTTKNGVNGRIFGVVPHQIFMPAASANGAFGIYWNDAGGFLQFVDPSLSGVNNDNRAHEFSVRCVAE